MKAKHDKGFTLLEVMVALAVVAIVSSPLLQMFVTTSYANKDAQVMDMANVIAVQQVETFKSDPEGYSPGNRYSYNYYRGDGTLISVDHDLADIPNGAVIMVKSDLPDPIVTLSNDAGYYPDFVGTIDLSQYTSDYTVNINNTYDIDVEPSTSPFAYDSSKIKDNILPIRVDYDGVPRTINVYNDSDLEVDFYVFNLIDPSDLEFITHQGASSYAYVPITGISSNKNYGLKLTVYRVSQGVRVEMFTYSVNKYIHN